MRAGIQTTHGKMKADYQEVYNRLKKEAQEIQDYLQITVSYTKADDNIKEVVQRGNDLSVYIARTGVMLSEAKHLLTIVRASDLADVMKKVLDEHLSAKIQNALLSTISAKEQRLVDWITEINKTCKYQIEWMRSLVSKAKTEMQYLN